MLFTIFTKSNRLAADREKEAAPHARVEGWQDALRVHHLAVSEAWAASLDCDDDIDSMIAADEAALEALYELQRTIPQMPNGLQGATHWYALTDQLAIESSIRDAITHMEASLLRLTEEQIQAANAA